MNTRRLAIILTAAALVGAGLVLLSRGGTPDEQVAAPAPVAPAPVAPAPAPEPEPEIEPAAEPVTYCEAGVQLYLAAWAAAELDIAEEPGGYLAAGELVIAQYQNLAEGSQELSAYLVTLKRQTALQLSALAGQAAVEMAAVEATDDVEYLLALFDRAGVTEVAEVLESAAMVSLQGDIVSRCADELAAAGVDLTEPEPEPTPEPAPAPAPAPRPEPRPEPTPTPEPAPEPSPAPAPSLATEFDYRSSTGSFNVGEHIVAGTYEVVGREGGCTVTTESTYAIEFTGPRQFVVGSGITVFGDCDPIVRRVG
jgi:hypothetical protein